MRYAITGPSEVMLDERAVMADTIGALDGVEVFSSGCATGVDTEGALLAALLYPAAEHRLIVPAAPSNVDELLRVFPVEPVVVYAPAGRTDAESYMLRNDLLADTDVLLAFPYHDREVLRSGTWATVRRARRRGADVRVVPLRGSG